MFKPGQSGNPSGRRAEDRKIKLLARQHTENAVKTLVSIMEKADTDASRVAAANAILDRAYGKPKQIVDAQLVKRIVDERQVTDIRDRLRAPSEERTVQ